MRKMSKALAVALACCIAFAAAPCAAGEEKPEHINRVTAALAEARREAEPHEANLERFLDADDAAWEKAAQRGEALAAAVKSYKDHTTYTLEGDTSLEDVGPLYASNSKFFTIDMNGYVLYAPVFGTGCFGLKNGTAADVMAENEEGLLRITVEQDACLVRDRNPAALDLLNGGDLTLVNRGNINGFRRLLYQKARSNRISITNEGTIWSDGVALSSRAFHQNSRVTLSNSGTMAGLVRGLDFHCSGGSFASDGKGAILGAAGPDLEFPKITLDSVIIADDIGLTADEEAAILNKLNPYGDKDAPSGIALDLQASNADYWVTWKVTGTLYASRHLLRAKFPKNSKMRGDIMPAIDAESPSRDALLTTELETAMNSLNGEAAQKNVDNLLKTLKLDAFCQKGGELLISAMCRYAEADGKAHIRYSTGDSVWSRITGKRTGKSYAWDLPENGTLPAQEPVQALNAYYQFKAGLSLAGRDGVMMLDQDVELPEGDGTIPLPQGIEIRGDGRAMTGVLDFTVNQKARISGLTAAQDPISLKSNGKVDTYVTLQGGHYGTLKLDNVILNAEDAEIENLEMLMWGGKADYTVKTVTHQLRIVSTERISGAFRFLMDIAPDAPEDAAIDISLMKGGQSKSFLFEGKTGAPAVTLMIFNDKNMDAAFRPGVNANLNETYAVYLRVINLVGLTGPDGKRPPLILRDENGRTLHTFIQGDDAKWTLAD